MVVKVKINEWVRKLPTGQFIAARSRIVPVLASLVADRFWFDEWEAWQLRFNFATVEVLG